MYVCIHIIVGKGVVALKGGVSLLTFGRCRHSGSVLRVQCFSKFRVLVLLSGPRPPQIMVDYVVHQHDNVRRSGSRRRKVQVGARQ